MKLAVTTNTSGVNCLHQQKCLQSSPLWLTSAECKKLTWGQNGLRQ